MSKGVDTAQEERTTRTPVVSLERDLVRTDLDSSGLIFCLKAAPLRTAKALLGGAWRDYVRDRYRPDPATLPYHADVVAEVRARAAAGETVQISACGRAALARAVADHLGVPARVTHADGDAPQRRPTGVRWKVLRRVLRMHQWAKNFLLLVPVLTAHRFDVQTLGLVLLGVVAFSLCASSVYILNDLVDLESDRAHPRKRARPFASGDCAIATGLMLAPILFGLSLVMAFILSQAFGWALIGYFALTTLYSLYLKSKLVVDVIVLAMLYTGRILAGGLLANVVVSHWLLAFSMFIFTALALMKRYVELSTLAANKLPDPQNRNYRASDLPIVMAMAVAAAMNAVTIFALYIFAGTEVVYTRPWALWLICPLLLYWLARALFIVHRLEMDDDPVLFALKDRNSRLALACAVVLVLIAI